jgi:hypothetical protein
MSTIKKKSEWIPKNKSVAEIKAKPSTAQLKHDLEKAQAFNDALLQAQLEHEKMHFKVVNDLDAKLDEAYKQHDHMLAVAFGQLDYVHDHLANIEYHAGSLTMEDVSASINVIKRILHNKFAYKPQMVEL